jgi:hypothetical protein
MRGGFGCRWPLRRPRQPNRSRRPSPRCIAAPTRGHVSGQIRTRRTAAERSGSGNHRTCDRTARIPLARWMQVSRRSWVTHPRFAMSTTRPGGVRRWSDREAPAPLQSAQSTTDARAAERLVQSTKQVAMALSSCAQMRSLRVAGGAPYAPHCSLGETEWRPTASPTSS